MMEEEGNLKVCVIFSGDVKHMRTERRARQIKRMMRKDVKQIEMQKGSTRIS